MKTLLSAGFVFIAGLLSAQSEAYTRPAEFKIGTEVQTADPGPFTATIGQAPGRTVSTGGFEPMTFRTKVEITEASENEIALNPLDWKMALPYRSGVWDGADVEVYRVRDGKLDSVRQSKVEAYYSAGWIPGVQRFESKDKWVAPDQTFYLAHFSSAFGENQTLYFAVSAVFADGKETRLSEPLKVEGISPSQGGVPKNKMVNIPKGFFIQTGDQVGPAGLRAEAAEKNTLKLSWQPVEGAAGYKVYMSDVDPAEHLGHRLVLSTDGPALREGDFAFLRLSRNEFSGKEIHAWTRGHKDYGSPRPLPGGGVIVAVAEGFSDSEEGVNWSYDPHPVDLPTDFAPHAGRTALKSVLDGSAPQVIRVATYYHGGEGQYWPVLATSEPYVLEFWAKAGVKGMKAKFTGNKLDSSNRREFDLATHWTRHRHVFTAPEVERPGGIGELVLEVHGRGEVWLDDLRLYPESAGFLKPAPHAVNEARISGMETFRFHNHIKSGMSYDMEMLTNPEGMVGTRGHIRPNNVYTLPALLDFCREAGVYPWLQVEIHMTDEEWLGMAEYLAAPYDPAVDSPTSKPWAYKRVLQGQQAPWIDEFDKIYFEIGNELWNWSFAPWVFAQGTVDEVTGTEYKRGALAGMYNERVMDVLRSSPYWSRIEPRWVNVLGGWIANGGSEQWSFTAQAVKQTPSADYATIATYNGGWDAGEGVAGTQPASLFTTLNFINQADAAFRDPLELSRKMVAEGRAAPHGFGTYEAGPGYAIRGVSGDQNRIQEERGKSMAMGTATLDQFLGCAAMGYTLQNFFTFNFDTKWFISHAPLERGGHAYPSWLGLVLWNNFGHGDFVEVETLSVPSADLQKHKRRQAVDDAPLVGVYATRREDGSLAVFVLSRKVAGLVDENGDGKVDGQDSGYTPVTLQLPAGTPRNFTVHRMSGPQDAHNLEEPVIKLEQFSAELAEPGVLKFTRDWTKEAADGLPPAVSYLLVFPAS